MRAEIRERMSEGTPQFELDTVAAGAAKARTMDALFGPGDAAPKTIGGYRILDVLGRGAMGVVYLGHDARLDREVALKLLDPQRRHNPEAKAALVEEAKQIARVQHPNVVAVYEVGDHEGVTFIAMEYVAGPTLREWTRAEGHRSRQILETYVDAGRGLAAVHDAGLLHRDFKASNVLVTATGLAKVADFGLARIVRSERSPVPAKDGSEPPEQSSIAIAGTPAYMAPEQFAGKATAKSDQFAFGVALLEALAGTPPFGLEPAFALDSDEAIRRLGRLDRARLPRWLFDVLSRAVAWDPEARWPDMHAVVAALDDDPRRRRWRWLAALGLVATTGSAGGLWFQQAQARAERCSGAQRQLETSWDGSRREAMRTAFLATDASYAQAAWSRTEADLDRYAHDWVATYEEACAATTVRGEQSTEIMDLRMACLHRANTTLGAITKVLAEADVAVVERAHDVVAGLSPVLRCSDIPALLEDVEPPRPEEAAAVESVRAVLARVAAQTYAGRLDAAQKDLAAAFEALADIVYPPAHVEAKLRQAALYEGAGNYADAEDTLREVLEQAAKERLWQALWHAQADLIFVVGNRRGHHEDGLRYLETATGLAGGDPEKLARVDSNVALVRLAQGDYAEAERCNRRALAAFEKALGPDSPNVATARNNLAAVLSRQGKQAEAEQQTRRGLEIRRKVLGPGHPATIESRNNLALTMMLAGRNDEAEIEVRGVLNQWTEMFGPQHPRVAEAHNNLGLVLQRRQRLPEAEAEHREALGIRQRVHGPNHPAVAESAANLADLLVGRGAHAEAIEQARRAVAIWERSLGPEHPNFAAVAHTLGRALAGVGEHDAAEAQLRRALAIWGQTLGPEHPDAVRAQADLSMVLRERTQAE